MAVEKFIVDTVGWLENIHFDEVVYGKPGRVIGYCVLAIIWLYVALVVYKDAEHRYLEGAKIKYYWLAAVLLTGPFGWLAYLALRPAVDLDESYLQKVEERYLSFESRGLGYCAKCGAAVDPDFLFCISCGKKIRARCVKCERVVEKMFEFCPTCGVKMQGKREKTVLGVDEAEVAENLRLKRLGPLVEKAQETAQKDVVAGITAKIREGYNRCVEKAKTFAWKPKEKLSEEAPKEVEQSDKKNKKGKRTESAQP